MFHLRLPQRIVLALGLLFAMGGALLIVTPRAAKAASNCKPNRASCTANNQCCSKVCTAGLCVADGGASCPRCGDGVVDNGEACDPQGTPATCNLDCTLSSCGDGKVNSSAAEQCDDANTDPGDGCYQCRIERCGNAALDIGEECDGTLNAGPFGCSDECFQIECGNGRLDPAEECDDGNDSDGDNCLSSDPDPATCHVAPGVVCGTGTQLVNGECVPEMTCPPPSCGDGIVDAGEEACDDGNVVTETECPYDTPSCTGCNADCSVELTLTGPFCGDGTTTCPEACDDNNTNTCGTCSAACAASQLAHATGVIVAVDGASLADGETFILDDGLGTVAVFEFDLASDGVDVASTAIDLLGLEPASLVATRIRNAINNHSALGIDAEANSNVVSLANERASSLGNQPITETVTNADFYVAGMAGGAGGDCNAGVGCSSDADCASGTCGTDIPGECDASE